VSSTSVPNWSLRGKVALVTGASSGIGAAAAKGMAAAGAQVMLVARNPERLKASQRAIQDLGGICASFEADLTVADAPGHVVEATLEKLGSLDIVVHAAGIFEPASFEETSKDNLDRAWSINVRAPFTLTQAALPHLREGSAIIFVTSVAGLVGTPGAAVYCACKGAVTLLMKSLALELAPRGVRVNAIAPGNTHTPMTRALFTSPGVEDMLVRSTPAGRIGEVDDIAPCVVFLASDAARYMYGTTLVVDGGWRAGGLMPT
jgi:NAD(P)-dependent dehydrogenase (short-subunit alcohol dehydrogenase family)